jgi:hypothetical protein
MTPAWSAPTIQALPGDRLHLQHGPIDVVLRAWGAEAAVAEAYEAAMVRFSGILPELAGELVELRKPMSERPRVEGAVARRMVAACRPYREFVTPMAAVAGAVADEILAAMTDAAPLDRAFVNDGGDIAVHLTEGESLAVAMAADFARGPVPAVNGRLVLRFEDGIGGIATSGAQGRSFSLGSPIRSRCSPAMPRRRTSPRPSSPTPSTCRVIQASGAAPPAILTPTRTCVTDRSRPPWALSRTRRSGLPWRPGSPGRRPTAPPVSCATRP